MFSFPLARSRFEDTGFPVSDRERFKLLLHLIHRIDDIAEDPYKHTINGLCGEVRAAMWELLDDATVAILGVDVDGIAPERNDDLRSTPSSRCASVLTVDLSAKVLEFESDWNLRVSSIVRGDPPVTDQQIFEAAAWSHREILRIRPLQNGNLLLAQLYALLVLTLAGVADSAAVVADIQLKLDQVFDDIDGHADFLSGPNYFDFRSDAYDDAINVDRLSNGDETILAGVLLGSWTP